MVLNQDLDWPVLCVSFYWTHANIGIWLEMVSFVEMDSENSYFLSEVMPIIVSLSFAFSRSEGQRCCDLAVRQLTPIPDALVSML